jgi:hypothetical protein
MNIGQSAGARERWIHVNDGRSSLLGLHHPAKSDGMALCHIRALDDAIRVLQILLECGCAPSSERSPKTGDGRGVSNTSLILDLNDPQRVE